MDAGTVFPYVKRAQAQGFEVVITNTNDNRRNGEYIEGSRSPEEHAATVWEKVVQPSDAKSIAVVAHSYGGHVASSLSNKFGKDFKTKVFAVALTDSVHSSHGAHSRFSEIGTNFVSSDLPLGTPVQSYSKMPAVSAGHPKHEMTSYACMEALFEFLAKMYQKERGKSIVTDDEGAGAENGKMDEL